MEQRFINLPKDHQLPFGWWGHRADPPAARSVIDLIEDGVLDTRIAAFLWLALEQRASLVVAAEPHEAGKTTTLTALLDFLPADVQPIYLRGWYERFEFLKTVGPDEGYILCNEISSHLPTYLWGRGVRRMFEAMQLGYGMATTVHASGAAGVFDVLTAYPLEVPLELASQIDLVVTLGVGAGTTGKLRRVMRLELVRPSPDGPTFEPIAERDVPLGSLASRPGQLLNVLCERFGLDAGASATVLARREQCLARLVRDGVRTPDAVRQAIHTFHDARSSPN